MSLLRSTYFSLGILLAMTGMIGCAVGPKYRRPTIDVPGHVSWRDA